MRVPGGCTMSPVRWPVVATAEQTTVLVVLAKSKWWSLVEDPPPPVYISMALRGKPLLSVGRGRGGGNSSRGGYDRAIIVCGLFVVVLSVTGQENVGKIYIKATER